MRSLVASYNQRTANVSQSRGDVMNEQRFEEFAHSMPVRCPDVQYLPAGAGHSGHRRRDKIDTIDELRAAAVA